MAGPKGSGLALMFELMCSLVVGNPIISNYFSDKPAARKHRQNAWLLAVDIGRFSSVVDYQQEVARTVATLRGLAPSDPTEAIRMPGERGQHCHVQRAMQGIPLSNVLIKELSECPRPEGMPLPW
jgi:ureidoglycolate dehydrogenase (NAD+)